jgi:hypothetical protein
MSVLIPLILAACGPDPVEPGCPKFDPAGLFELSQRGESVYASVTRSGVETTGSTRAKIRISNRLHPTPRGAQMGWNRVMPEVMRSFFADFRAWPRTRQNHRKPTEISGVASATGDSEWKTGSTDKS